MENRASKSEKKLRIVIIDEATGEELVNEKTDLIMAAILPALLFPLIEPKARQSSYCSTVSLFLKVLAKQSAWLNMEL